MADTDHGGRSQMPGAGQVRNIHGRRPGRGMRPYLIVLKILSVAVFFGGLVVVLIGVLLRPEPLDGHGWRDELVLIHRIYVGVIIPGLAAALVFGTLLFASIWRVMIRMRWFVTKMILIFFAVPALHVFMRSRSLAVELSLAQPTPDLQQASVLRDQMVAGTALAIVFAIATIILGRVKPRLGQDYGRTFARPARPD
jgi:hypothetical protein